MQGDDTIRAETSGDSKVDKKIKSICKGCWRGRLRACAATPSSSAAPL